ncbi:MAG TPA: sigma-54 dependent transcriptional regulator [Candidatus Limnocylindrales bacterium]|jgi:two-component system response regulator AtoC|nr:sigma-54 dependent transcriptional regulator [Candidatus Limnocylindrales bacterium]
MNVVAGTPSKARVLVVDDEPGMLLYTSTLLETCNYAVQTARSGPEALLKLQQQRPDLMLLDVSMPEMNGLETIQAARRLYPDQRVVMVSCVSETSTVVQAMRLGALDYMTKPIYKAELEAVLARALSKGSLADEEIPTIHFTAVTDQENVDRIDDDMFFLAASPAMKQLRAQLSIISKVDVPILLLGESGVGKEVMARLIHNLSPRSGKPFVKVNCAALPLDLLESELFGYEAGAFTGATRQKPGKFEIANQGTIFLDEIGEMNPLLQAKLLHVLQDGEFSRLGGRGSVRADVRVLAATNIDIQRSIAQRTFREDLYYRLNAFTLNIPPLRERREEIPPLLQQYGTRYAKRYGILQPKYSQSLQDACLRYHWPGNLRELGNFVKRFIVLQDEGLAIAELKQKGLPDAAQPGDGAFGSGFPNGLKTMVRNHRDELEIKVLQEALEMTNWNRKLAATRLHISYKALLNKIKQYRLIPPRPF